MRSAPARAQACATFSGPTALTAYARSWSLFGGVDLGVGRAVDHDVTGLDEPLGRRRVGDVPLRRRQRQHVAALLTSLSCQEAPHHATSAGDNDSVSGHACESGTPIGATRSAAVSQVAWADARSPDPCHRCRGGPGHRRRHRRGVGQDPLVRIRHQPHLLDGARRGWRGRRDRHPAGRHGQPHRRPRQPAVRRGTGDAAGRRRRVHQHRHDHPGAHPQQREVGHRDLDPARLLRRGAGCGQDEDQRRLRVGAPGETEAAGRAAGRRPAEAEPAGHRSRPRSADQDRRQPDRRHRRPLRRDRAARLRADHRRPRRRQRLSERCCVRTTFGGRLPCRLAEAGRPAGTELRPAAPRPAPRRPGPG